MQSKIAFIESTQLFGVILVDKLMGNPISFSVKLHKKLKGVIFVFSHADDVDFLYLFVDDCDRIGDLRVGNIFRLLLVIFCLLAKLLNLPC